MSILNSDASGGQGTLLKNRPLDPHKTFYIFCLTIFLLLFSGRNGEFFPCAVPAGWYSFLPGTLFNFSEENFPGMPPFSLFFQGTSKELTNW
jgi:hypothetical protein